MAKRVAVVAVHGVADQQPHDSAWQVAGLLTAFGAGYAPWVANELQLPLDPLLEEGRPEPTPKPQDPSPGFGFMYELLRHYRREERTFNTIRLEGETEEKKVDVYEAYWADLSKLAPSAFDFFAELYQLLLHLPSLGRTVVREEAKLHAGQSMRWDIFTRAQRFSVWMLIVVIALMNLVLLTFVAPVLVTRLDATPPMSPVNRVTVPCGEKCPEPVYVCVKQTSQSPKVPLTPALFIVLVTAIGTAFSGWLVRDQKLHGAVWTAVPVIAAVAFALLSAYLARTLDSLDLLGILAWIIAAGIAASVASKYSYRRPGAMKVALVLLGAGAAFFLWRLVIVNETLLNASVQTIDIFNIILKTIWVVYISLTIITAFAGLFCVVTAKTRRAEARRAAWTARATLGLSTSLFGLLTLSFWGAILLTAEKLLPARCVTLMALPNLGEYTGSFKQVAELLLGSAGEFFMLSALLLGAFVLSVLWSIVPSILLETSAGARTANALTDDQAEVRGRWLAFGLKFIPGVLNLLLFAGAAGFFYGLSQKTLVEFLRPFHASAPVLAAGAILLGFVTARMAIPAASKALDVALDVDNYLREHPIARSPRARIAERFASLFRHIASQDYDGIVLVAHSQGSVITADLLRFMRILGSDIYAKFAGKTRLFTMGNPMRQLYENAFPPLYSWMEPSPNPDPAAEIGVTVWVNAYRTGDYVGRYVWRQPDDPALWRKSQKSSGTWEDRCIGAGAHTHYWDDTSVLIGKRLEELVSAI